MPPCPGQNGTPAPPMGWSRSGRFGRCERDRGRRSVVSRFPGNIEMSDPAGSAEAVARARYGKLLAFMAARTGDLAGAEDALSEAFATALTEWPARGVPDNPQA